MYTVQEDLLRIGNELAPGASAAYRRHLADDAVRPDLDDVVFGGVIAVLSIARVVGAHRAEWLSWMIVAAGIWVFTPALWLDETLHGRGQRRHGWGARAVFGVASAMATHDGKRGGEHDSQQDAIRP